VPATYGRCSLAAAAAAPAAKARQAHPECRRRRSAWICSAHTLLRGATCRARSEVATHRPHMRASAPRWRRAGAGAACGRSWQRPWAAASSSPGASLSATGGWAAHERGLRRPGRQALSTEAAEYNPRNVVRVLHRVQEILGSKVEFPRIVMVGDQVCGRDVAPDSDALAFAYLSLPFCRANCVCVRLTSFECCLGGWCGCRARTVLRQDLGDRGVSRAFFILGSVHID
jgi:hypothetical protein